MANYTARHLGVLFAVTRTMGEGMGFHRMHDPESGAKVSIIEDLVFTDGEVGLQAELFAKWGLCLLGMSAWIIRDSASLDAIPFSRAMTGTFFEQYRPEVCPLCQPGEHVAH